VYPPSEIFAKLVNKNAIKHQKGVPPPKNFHNPYIPSLPKFGKNLLDPPPIISNRVHLWSSPSIATSRKRSRKREKENEREREKVRKRVKHIISPVSNPLYPVMCGSLHRLLEDPRDVSRVGAVDGDLKKEE
jgi:hypothetical protein